MTGEVPFLEPLAIQDAQTKKTRRNTVTESPTGNTSFSFLKKLWRDKKNTNRKSAFASIGSDFQYTSEEFPSPSPVLFRRNISRKTSAYESNNEDLLSYAVTNQDSHTLVRLLNDEIEPVDINFMRPPGVSALHQACVFGDINIVKLIVENGGNIHLRTWTKLSPLQIAVIFGNYETAQYLLSCGADCDDIKNGIPVEKQVFSAVRTY